MIGLTLDQSGLRLLNIDQHEILAGTHASLAPGFETADALATSKATGDYRASRTGCAVVMRCNHT